MAPPSPSLSATVAAAVALIEHNRSVLLRGDCWLASDFHLEVEDVAEVDAKKTIVLGPFQKDRIQGELSGMIPKRAYNLSRFVGACAPMQWIAVYARESIPNLAYKQIWNTELANPIDMNSAPIVPRARGAGAFNVKHPSSIPTGGACARKTGRSAIAVAFANDIKARKIDMFEIAAQSLVKMEAGRTYTYGDLFGHARFPVVARDNCCLMHFELAEKKLRERARKESNASKPRPHRVTRARAILLREAARKAAARKVVAMDSLYSQSSDSDKENML